MIHLPNIQINEGNSYCDKWGSGGKGNGYGHGWSYCNIYGNGRGSGYGNGWGNGQSIIFGDAVFAPEDNGE